MPLSEKNKNLVKAYFEGFESKEEFAELNNWFDSEENELLPEPLQQQSKSKIRKRLLASIKSGSAKSKIIYLRPILRITAAVAMVISGVWGYYYYKKNYIYTELDREAIAQIMPIQDSVKLTFEDGKVVFLSPENEKNQEIDEAQAIVDGQLVYHSSSSTVVNNIVTTPKGNIFKISLPDGTQVWMNAKSKLSFPSKFLGSERKVRLEGEAYFEVAKDDKQAFVVVFADQKVKVLGTHFNITAYEGGIQRTTLMEGKIQLERGNEVVTLSPNEQVLVIGSKIQKRSVDASEYINWRDGYFVFHNATPNEIMQQLTLWYDLKVKPGASGLKEQFSGKISKDMNLAEVLEVLQVAGIHFKISENNLNQKEIELRE